MENNNRVPPHSVEAEQAVLGAILLDNTIISIANKRISSNVFYKQCHTIIFQHMQSLYNQGKSIDLVMLIEELRNSDMLDSVGGIDYITALQIKVPNSQNINHYLNIWLC